jgi:hypothetical protein
MNLVKSGSVGEVLKGQRAFGIKIRKEKMPGSGGVRAKEIQIEVTQHSSFGFVCIEFKAIVLDNLNLVPTTPLISAGVEVSSVLITFDSSPDFGALFSKGQFGLRRTR